MIRHLITTDIHLTEKKEDHYRFDLFKWIQEEFHREIQTVYILGDITDRKNYHADWFVNRIVEALRELSQYFRVDILMGNHDYDTSPNHPFFDFINTIPRVRYFTQPYIDVNDILILPHTRTPGDDWEILRKERNPRAILMHQTFRGAITESGHEMGGISWTRFKKYNCPIYSGDIHRPQELGPITYVGSPYHIRYGDGFNPRMILVDKDMKPINSSIRMPAPRKHVFELTDAKQLRKAEFEQGDRAKVKLFLPRSEFDTWPEQRDLARRLGHKRGLKIHSVVLKELQQKRKRVRLKKPKVIKSRSRKDLYRAFCVRYEVGKDLVEAGREFMGE